MPARATLHPLMTRHVATSVFAAVLAAMVAFVVPGTLAVSQDAEAQQGGDAVEVTLRDGTRWTVHDVQIGRTGIECRLGEDRLRLSWDALAPRTVYRLRYDDLEENDGSLNQWVELAEWCAAYPELQRETMTMLERVLRANPKHRRAKEALGSLGYIFRDGLLRDREEWERRQRERESEERPDEAADTDEEEPRGEADDDARPEPAGPAREPGERLRVSVELSESIDWAGHARANVEATRTAEAIFVEYLEERDIVVTDEDPHYRIIGRVVVTCFKNVQFFENSIAIGFTGRATITATRTHDGSDVEIPEATTRQERPDAQAALDGVLQALARRLGANAAARLR